MDNWYLLIANHRTWMDILVLSYVFNSKVCGMRFFMKKELIWQLGLAGMSCWILRYPFLARHTKEQIRKNPKLKGKDIESARIACNRLKKLPCTLISFAEGTRFTRRKHARQKSPFVHLLKPKAGGVAVVIQEMHNELSGIIDVTIKYRIKKMSFWNFVCGRVKKITVLSQLRPLSKDLVGDYYHNREFRRHFQGWLNEVWQEKDRLYQDIR